MKLPQNPTFPMDCSVPGMHAKIYQRRSGRYRVNFTVDRVRRERSFMEFPAAWEFLQDKIKDAKRGRFDRVELDARTLRSYARCEDLLDGTGRTVEEAVEFFLKHLTHGKQFTVSEVVEAYITDRRKAKVWSDETEKKDSRFYRSFPEAPQFSGTIESILAADIQDYLCQWDNLATRKTYLRKIRAVWAWAKKHRYIAAGCDNEASKVDIPKNVDYSDPEIFSLDEVDKLFKRIDTELAPALAMRLFAGLRRAEAERLEWKHIFLYEGYIEIPAEVSKTSRRRIVTLRPNLKRWLELVPVQRRVGKFVARDAYTKISKQCGDLWKRNGTRHSFVSYCMSLRGATAATVAEECGHSVQVLHTHYRNLVAPGQGQLYFRIDPAMLS